MFKKILVAFDGSAHSKEALRKAVELAGKGGHLTILSVAPHPTSWIVGGQMGVAFGSEELQKEIDNSWTSQLDQALATVPMRFGAERIRSCHTAQPGRQSPTRQLPATMTF